MARPALCLAFLFPAMMGCFEFHDIEGGTRADASRPDGGRADTSIPPIDATLDRAMPFDSARTDAGFDTGPVGDRCSGGETFIWVLGVVSPIVEDRGVASGFDLDGLPGGTGASCFQSDFRSPTSERDIDNQWAALVPTLDPLSGEPMAEAYLRTYLEGEPPVLIEARHVDDLGDDDCVDVLVHRGLWTGGGRPPIEMIVYRDGETFRSFESFRFATAEIADQTLSAQNGTYPFVVPVADTLAINRLGNARLRAGIDRSGRLGDVLVGGALAVEDAVESFVGAGEVPPEVVRSVLESFADLDQDPAGSTCTSLSVGIAHLTGAEAFFP